MSEDTAFKQVAIIRAITLKEVESLSDDLIDKGVNGFNNTIRWNLGHIYTFQNLIINMKEMLI